MNVDEETAQSCHHLDETSITLLFRRQTPFLHRFFKRRGAQPDDIPDLIQDTFTVFWIKRSEANPGKAEAFLSGTARNTLLAHLRRQVGQKSSQRAHHTTIVQNLHGPSTRPGDSLLTEERAEQIRALVARLPKRMAQIFSLRYLE